MLVCWEWLSQYVDLTVDDRELALRLAMSGLNHESTEQVGTDTVIDLEVTSNRGDCLGHIGVAREAAVLLGSDLKIPTPQPPVSAEQASSLLSVNNQFVDACPRYTARIVRGVKIGPSPDWLVRRLAAIGVTSINNVVDVTNYVMFECGQPLHAFDLAHIRGGRITVRPAEDKEPFLAIDHHTYELDSKMVVIADAERAVALGGVMGGAESEVSEATTDLLIEAAAFTPLAIRRTARKLKLHSPSSYRFERRPDPGGLDWASLRCCELILEIAGGSLCDEVVDCGDAPAPREPITFRLNQIPRILGIDIPSSEAKRILAALGCEISQTNDDSFAAIPPSWRTDLQREVDLLEEVARIYGYDQIPDDAMVPLSIASPRPKDIALTRVRQVLSAYGMDEAMTPSVVTETLENCGSLWTTAPPLLTETPLLIGSRSLRRSLLPSLLSARHTNQTLAIRNAQLYEVANIYVPGKQAADVPRQQSTLGIVTEGNLSLVKGVVEEILEQVLSRGAKPEWIVKDHPFFLAGSSLCISLGKEPVGFVGLVDGKIQESLALDQPVAAAELNVDLLTDHLEEVRRADPVSAFPAVSRDLNFIVDEPLRWNELAAQCRAHGGTDLQDVLYQETYRDTKKDGANKKRTLLTLHFQSLEGTLTGGRVDAAVERVIEACKKEFGAKLLS